MAAARLGGFALVLAVAFAGAYGIGQAFGPVDSIDSGDSPAEPAAAGHGHGGGGESGGESGGHAEGEPLPAGLRVTADGHTLEVVDPRGFAFRILDESGDPVTRFTPNHDKLMHLIVARRDLSGFRHVHPEMSADGTWRVPLDLRDAGDYRMFADFVPAGRTEPVTLGVDVPVPGDYRPVPMPPPALTAEVDGYRVTLSGHLDAGTTSRLTLTVDKGGVPVTDLQPYLGAYGHLVALRQGDLAYLHVHPHDGAAAGPSVTFDTEVPSTGTYRLYLDFKHGDVVRTAEFTAVAEPHEER
ncbi:hypothetical protein [Actinophytocola gossypii]|uniref:Heavy-metal-associated domain-containing protein n=1 Tax=Actinophytocola gossypii TaxID=2812003 RepID=A0ABT2J8Q6_9PSEU|nr:hypothetical protein [Actinophytocola gossypii]MCT2584247.1 hypothetical protein [Actinophytocola gossypii]